MGVKSAWTYLFYRLEEVQQSPPTASRADFQVALWRPSVVAPWPPGVTREKRPHFLFRTLLHLLQEFPSRDSGALTIYDGPCVVHYSALTPRFWRFPFLSVLDIQVGDTWTEKPYRGKGLAKYALLRLVAELQRPGRSFWCVVEDVNRPSVKVAEDCGFDLASVGIRVKRMRAFD